MSADAWSVCPRCKERALRAWQAEVARVADLYGRVPVGEFDAARAAIGEVRDAELTTFREYYEFYGAEGGEVTAHYRGSCDVCDLSCEFDHDVRFYDPATDS